MNPSFFCVIQPTRESADRPTHTRNSNDDRKREEPPRACSHTIRKKKNWNGPNYADKITVFIRVDDSYRKIELIVPELLNYSFHASFLFRRLNFRRDTEASLLLFIPDRDHMHNYQESSSIRHETFILLRHISNERARADQYLLIRNLNGHRERERNHQDREIT